MGVLFVSMEPSLRYEHTMDKAWIQGGKNVLDWVAAAAVFIVGSVGLWHFVRRNLQEHEAWVLEEQERFVSEYDPYMEKEPWDMTS